MARTLQVEELMVSDGHNMTIEARLRSYELLAESFGVAKRLERKVLGVAK